MISLPYAIAKQNTLPLFVCLFVFLCCQSFQGLRTFMRFSIREQFSLHFRCQFVGLIDSHLLSHTVVTLLDK